MITRTTVAAMLVAGAAAIAGALGAATPAHADDYTYLAIVYSPATGAYGRGGTDCHLLVDFVDSCGALAVQIGNPGRYVTGDEGIG